MEGAFVEGDVVVGTGFEVTDQLVLDDALVEELISEGESVVLEELVSGKVEVTAGVVLGVIVGAESVAFARDGVAAHVETRTPSVKEARPSAPNESIGPGGILPTISSLANLPYHQTSTLCYLP